MNIIELAKQVGFQTDNAGVWVDDGYIDDQLEVFADLVAAHEREECAKLCEEKYEYYGHDHVFAKAIRARGEK